MSVSIVGWSHLPFGRLDKLGLEDLVVSAARQALDHAGIDGSAVDGAWLGNLNGGFTPDILHRRWHCRPTRRCGGSRRSVLRMRVLLVQRQFTRHVMPSSQDVRALHLLLVQRR